MFKKAEERYLKDLDIISFSKTIRESINFQKNYLSNQQKLLMKFDYCNVINAETDGSEVEDYNERMVSNISGDNGMVAMFTLGKLSQLLSNYTQSKLEFFDNNLFKSFYSSKSLAKGVL